MANLRTPLYDWHLARHGRMVPFGGWDMPVQFAGILEEHRAVRSAAGLFDISHMGRLSFAGADALRLIQAVFTNDAAAMADGQVRYGLVCNAAGGVLDDVLVYRLPAGWAMVVNASNREKVLAWVRGHAAGLDAEVADRTLATAMLAVQGPRAVELCRGLFETDPGSLAYYHSMPTRWRGDDCLVSRTGYTGEDGLEVTLDAGHAAALADELTRRGAVPCGLGARDTLRLEAAMPLYGHELTEETDPFQAGLGWAVKLDKGDFVGRDALARLKGDATRPRRAGVAVEGRRAAREGSVVLAEGRPVGRVTSGSFSPTLGRPIALAYLEPSQAAVGMGLTVDIRGTPATARVVPLPFYKRRVADGR